MANFISSKPEGPTLGVTKAEGASLLHDRIKDNSGVPRLRLNTVKHRQRISDTEKIDFQVKLLRSLRQEWQDAETEARFLEAVTRIESDGCALFGGLIDPTLFKRLVEEYDKVQDQSGNNAFMHSYVNLATEHDFIMGGNYVEAFSHPLLVALISYLLGGSIRIVDFRGKDNDPISINAQDNMLHVDNTPFKEEYKILLNWRRGQVKGPSGQNFTFLPWTHRGNRDILTTDEGLPWSTERESLFVTPDAISGLFEFQKTISGVSRVVEARHPEQPLAVLFPAGALVHHRYRTESGDPRSCIITAFHLSSKHPGQISEIATSTGNDKSLMEFLVGHQDGSSNEEFLGIISREAHKIESKLQELFQSKHPSQFIDLKPLALHGERLTRWHDAVIAAPSPIEHKFNKNLRLSHTNFTDLEVLTKTLAAVMDYDKHCNLQMVLYEDGREEIRKPGRKVIGEMKKDEIEKRLKAWTPELQSTNFSARDLVEPKTLRMICDMFAALSKQLAENTHGCPQSGASHRSLGQEKMFVSFSRLATDLGEAIVRCDGVEAYVVTSLFIFWTSEEINSHLHESDKRVVRTLLVTILRNYVATTLLVEASMSMSCHSSV